VHSFLSLLDVSHADLNRLLALADQMKVERHLGPAAPTCGILAGLHVALLFEKPSLRTRSTFEIAVHELGADTLHLPAELAEGVREPLEDIARNLERWVHALVLRTFGQEKALRFAQAGRRLKVINALTDEEHPCQALADVMTMREQWRAPAGRTIAYVGDGNNVATSLAHAACMLGIHVRVASPPGYALPDRVLADATRIATEGATVSRCTDPYEAVRGADAVYTDVWASMGEESEAAQRRGVFMPYQVNAALMAAAKPGALFMHCLPAHRGEEVTADVIESPTSVVFDQAENRLHTQKALLAILLGQSAPSSGRIGFNRP
jgi:ornithine carbamoyltransferase